MPSSISNLSKFLNLLKYTIYRAFFQDIDFFSSFRERVEFFVSEDLQRLEVLLTEKRL